MQERQMLYTHHAQVRSMLPLAHNNDRHTVAIAFCCTQRNAWYETQASKRAVLEETGVVDRALEPCLER
ncbi:hypothetical protein H6F86_19970 [Phormidium sp. FACHB-592]|uniref:Uncharacterized protein n=1 Tax=Stenomitos frigidus AS-A4 TaxID=2933935 RepID=A0ABV0KEK7_9CYAN|nr:hypothetical protein [Phormidium sp. FACHB-592]